MVVTGEAPEAELPALNATTGTRLPARILDTDRSVSVVNRQTIEDRQIDDPQEAVQQVAGAVRAGSDLGYGEDFLIRGFQQQDLFKDGFRAGQNDSTNNSATGPTDVANLERIEFLKGPAAILYGRGETGGIVNYVTRLPYFDNTLSFNRSSAPSTSSARNWTPTGTLCLTSWPCAWTPPTNTAAPTWTSSMASASSSPLRCSGRPPRTRRSLPRRVQPRPT